MKIQDNNGQFRLTIPKDLVKIKGWGRKTEVVVVLNDHGDLVIKDVKKMKGK